MNVMMSLGGFQFSLATTSYQDLSRSTSYRWASNERIGQHASKQFTGFGDDDISLQGVIYPEVSWMGSRYQIDNLRALATQGEPLLLVSGTGDILGRWVIEKIDEQQSIFADFGVARKQGFTINLKYFDEGETANWLDALENLAGMVNVDPSYPSALDMAKTNTEGVVATADNAAGSAISSLNGAMTELKSVAESARAQILPVMNAVNNGIRMASDVRETAKMIKSSLKNINDLKSLGTNLYNLSNLAAKAANAGTIASKVSSSVMVAASNSPAVSSAARTAVAASGTLATGMGRAWSSVTDLARSIV